MARFCDFETLKLSWKPNQFLMLPEGFVAAAEAQETSPVFSGGVDAVYDRLKAIIDAEPRIEWLAEDKGQGRMELVQRSKTFRFPDRISIAVQPAGEGAALAVYSRAKIGIRDFGVNKARITRWVAALQAA